MTAPGDRKEQAQRAEWDTHLLGKRVARALLRENAVASRSRRRRKGERGRAEAAAYRERRVAGRARGVAL